MKRRVIVTVVVVLVLVFVALLVAAMGRCEVFLLSNGKPMAGYFAAVWIVDPGSRPLSNDTLDAQGRLSLGWRLWNRPKSVIIVLSDPGGHDVATRSFDGSVFNGAEVDMRGPTTIITRKWRFGFFTLQDVQNQTVISAPKAQKN